MEGVGAFVTGAIVGKLVLDKSKWSAAISEVKKDQSTLAGWGKAAAHGIDLLGKAIVTTGLTAAFTLNRMVNRYTEAGEAIYEMSLRTGVATETLSELAYIGDLCGVSTQEMERSWKKMAATITDARHGNEGAIQTFKDMNLNFVDLIDLKPDQQFMKIGEALARMTDDTKESNAAQEIFGRTGLQMNTIFKEGPEVFARLREEARKLGIVYTKDAAAGADRLSDAKRTLKGAVTGLSMAIVERLIPAITAIVKTMTDALVGIRSKSGAITEAIISTFVAMVEIIKGVGLAFMGLKAIVFYTAEYISKGMAKILGWEKTVFETLGKVFPYFKKSAAGLQVGIDRLTFASDEYAKSVQEEIDKMTGFIIGVDAIIAKVRELTKAKKESTIVPVIPVGEALTALPPGKDVWKSLSVSQQKSWAAMTSADQAMLMQLSADFSQQEMMLDTLDQAWQRAVASMTDSLTTFAGTTGGIFGVVAGMVKGFIGEIISSLGKMIIAEQLATIKIVVMAKVQAIAKAISSIFSKLGFWGFPLALLAVGLVTALFSKIAKFEKGGPVLETGPAIVHRGEYITPAGAAGGPGRIEMVFAPVFNISTLDPLTTRDVVREKIGPELLDMLTAKILQPDFRKALGVRT